MKMKIWNTSALYPGWQNLIFIILTAQDNEITIKLFNFCPQFMTNELRLNSAAVLHFFLVEL